MSIIVASSFVSSSGVGSAHDNESASMDVSDVSSHAVDIDTSAALSASSFPSTPSTLVSPSNADSIGAVVTYVPGGVLPQLKKFVDGAIAVRVANKFISHRNGEVAARALWGTDVYTDDSDVVAIIAHCGRMIVRSTPPQSDAGVTAILRVLPKRDAYFGTERFGIRSRTWKSQYHRFSIQLLRIEQNEQSITAAVAVNVKGKVEGAAAATTAAQTHNAAATEPKQLKMLVVDKNAGMRRTIMQKRRNIPDVTLRWNSQFDVCLAFSLHWILDRGLDDSAWSSSRLRREVFYFDSANERFELSKAHDANTQRDRYRWAQMITAKNTVELLPTTIALTETSKRARIVVPAAASAVTVIHGDLDWAELEWAPKGVYIRGAFYLLRTIQVRAISK